MPHRATITRATGTVVASWRLVNKLEPRATFLDGRYRLDRLVVAHDDVTIWNATDMARGLSVQLSVFERGGAVLNQGKIAGGMFVAVDAASHAPELEIAASEDAFEPEPRRRRAWPWAVAGVACALVAFAGFHVMSSRSRPVTVSETTITAATVAAPEIATTPVPIVKAPEPTPIVEAPVVQPPPPPHHVKPAPLPALQKPSRARLRAQPMPTTNGDPLTL